MNKIRWLYNRFRQMSMAEIFKFRIPQFTQIHFLGCFQKNKKATIDKIAINPSYKLPYYNTSTLEKLLDNFTFQYTFFNTTVDLAEVKNWRKDYKNNKASFLKYYGKIDRQDFEEYGDVKYVSEISRLHFLPFFAFKACVSNNKKELSLITNILENWSKQNPYLDSIHWTSGIEVGIRSINLIYTHQVLKTGGLLSSEIDTLIKKQISYNFGYLKNHLSLYSSANNHLIGELLGLVAISNYFSSINFDADKWNNFFYNEFRKQVNNDGVDMELSTRYHATVTEHFLNGFEFIKRAGKEIPNDVVTKFKKMFDFVNHSVLDKKITCFGDDDDSKLVYPYFDKKFSLYSSLLQSSNHLFHSNYNSEELDGRNYLIFGDEIKNNTIQTNYQDALFSESGYCFMYDDKTKIAYDVGTIGDNLLAAHGHSDMLHFTFESNKNQYIVDCGTYQYHKKELFFRNYFKGITAHNTISINNKNHAISNGRMGWKNNPASKIIKFNFNSNKSFCSAEHFAFENEGVLHSRRITLDKVNKLVTIIDDLRLDKTEKQNELDFFLHFHPTIKVVHGGEDKIKLFSNKGKFVVIENQQFKNAEIIMGDKLKPLGWYSEKYDNIQPTSCLKLTLKLEKTTTLITTINYFSA